MTGTVIRGVILFALLILPTVLVASWMSAASQRLKEAELSQSGGDKVAVAAEADETYCTADLRKILRRVLQSCGLLSSGEGRGCQPVEARNVATMSDRDFNALFVPM